MGYKVRDVDVGKELLTLAHINGNLRWSRDRILCIEMKVHVEDLNLEMEEKEDRVILSSRQKNK